MVPLMRPKLMKIHKKTARTIRKRIRVRVLAQVSVSMTLKKAKRLMRIRHKMVKPMARRQKRKNSKMTKRKMELSRPKSLILTR